jgi:hypothetical protein
MAIEYKITLSDVPLSDYDASYYSDVTVPEVIPPDGAGWTLEYSVRGESKLYHFWTRGTTIFHEGLENYWTGAADNVATGELGTGVPLEITVQPGQTEYSLDAEFDLSVPTWVWGGQAAWVDAGIGDYASAEFVAKASVLQTTANKDLAIDGDKVVYVGLGAGTHGFAQTPVLVPNQSATGKWNYDVDTNTVTPATDNGKYDIFVTEQVVSRFVNKVMLLGNSNGYKEFASQTGWKIPPGYFVRFSAYNNSQTTWTIAFLLNLIRERTV